MFSLSWLRERGVTRGRPTTRRTARIAALGALIASGLLQTGCQSGPFSRYGIAGRATARVVQPVKRILGCCGPSYVSDVPIEYAEPIGVVAPAVPYGPAAPVIEGAPVPSTVAPASPDAPTSLEPLPSAEPGPSPTTRGSGVRKPSSYDAQRPAANPGRGENLAHTLVSTPDPEVRPARESAKPLNRTAAVSDFDGVLDQMPPLDLPPEVTERSDTPPVAPAAVKPKPETASPSIDPAPDSNSASAPAPANDHSFSGRSGRRAEPALDQDQRPAPDIEPAASAALGIDRFVAVDLKLAGGSAPSTVGLGWLSEKGYKTLLDLRDTSEFSSSFIGEAAKRGLRYVSFPTDLEDLDREHIERFSAELALNDARPLYFFDDDGSRAGAMWFIRRVLDDKVGWDVARREAEEIGPLSAEAWREVRETVDRQLAHVAPASPRNGADNPRPEVEANAKAADPPTPDPDAKPAAPMASPKPTARMEPAEGAISSAIDAIQATTGVPTDAWRPATALFLTGLSFPLAYFGRSVIPVILAKTRASLPGPGPQPKSLPPASDA